MKRILTGALAALLSAAALATTLSPVQLLNPAGSTSGQVIKSTGASTAPAWGNVTATNLAAQAANTVLGNVTASSASPTAFAMPSCSGAANALTYTTSTGFTCNSALNAATLGGATFASPGSIGSTTPGSGAFTNLSASGTVSGTGFTAITAGRLLGVQVFSSSGTYTPTTGTTNTVVKVCGAGGGGGGTPATAAGQVAVSGGGHAGTYAEWYWPSPTAQTVTLGTAGTGGAAGANNGGAGGNTTIGSLLTAPGGGGGLAGTSAVPGSVPTYGVLTTIPSVTVGTLLDARLGDFPSIGSTPSTGFLYSGGGASSPFGRGAQVSGLGAGVAATGFCAGGGGAAQTPSGAALAGGAGTGGYAVFFDYQ